MFCYKGEINLKRRVDLEMGGGGGGVEGGGGGGGGGGVATFLLSYSSITFTVFVGKVKFPLLLFEYSVF